MSECLADPPGEADPILAAIEAAQEAAESAVRALTSIDAEFERSRRQRDMGMPLPMIVDSFVSSGGQGARHAAAAALQGYERAVMILRAEIIRELVDEHGYSLAEAGRSMRISRQMASRLLDASRSGTIPGE
jgi:hypothetical protein